MKSATLVVVSIFDKPLRRGLLKPVLGGVDCVAPFITVNEQSKSNTDCNFHSTKLRLLLPGSRNLLRKISYEFDISE